MPTLTRRMVLLLVALLVLLCALVVVVYVVYLSPTGLKAHMNSDLGKSLTAPIAHFTTLEGTTVDMGEYEGELLIVNFWASWSPFTQSDHRILGELKSQFTKHVTIRAVNRKEDVATAQAYLDTIGRVDGIEYILDSTDFLYAERGGYAMPETVIFDATGNEIERIRGTLTLEEIRETIAEVLAQTD